MCTLVEWFVSLQEFCFQNESCGKLVHAGVLEFTSSESNVAFLPQWMFDHLEVEEGIPPLYMYKY